MAWLRLYTDILNKPKISRLSDKLFRTWVELLLAAKEHGQGGELPPMDDLCFMLRMDGKSRQLMAMLEELKERKLVDQDDEGIWTMHDWKTHQYTSDDDPTAKDRKRRERDRKHSVTGDVTRDKSVMSRPPETETEQNRDREGENAAPAGAGSAAPRPSKPAKKTFGEYRHVRLTDDEHARLKADFNGKTDGLIRDLDEYIQKTGKSYKDHALTIRTWARKDGLVPAGDVGAPDDAWRFHDPLFPAKGGNP